MQMSQQKKSLIDILKEKKLFFDVINIILGIAVVILIMLLFLFPSNLKLVIIAVFLGGIINIFNGYRQFQQKKDKGMVAKSMMTTGTFLVIMAACLLFLIK